MNTTTQRRNKQARVATVSAPAIAQLPADTPPTPPDIQPCANVGLHRTVWGEGKARAVLALADEQGLDLERPFAYSNGDTDVPFLETVSNPVAVSPEPGLRAGAQRGGWPVLRCEGRPATPGPLELAGTAAFYGGMFVGMGAGLGVGLRRHWRRERVDIGGQVGADLGLALAGIDGRVVSGADHLWSARPCVFVFNHESKLEPILIMKLLRGGFTGVAKKEADRGFRKLGSAVTSAFAGGCT
jgi:putative phosphoserine phosphatase / 1-acylglycerol-3-phosphate O-acyltransferase